MQYRQIKWIIQISVIATLTIGVACALLTKIEVFSFDAVRYFTGGLTCVTIFWTFYFQWGWKFPLLKFLFNQPNINGTWIGKLKTDWIDQNGKSIAPKDFVIVVRQTLLEINFTTFTNQFVARSYAETFIVDKVRGIKQIAYLYRQDNTCIDDEDNRVGATELRLVEDSTQKMLGKYWSNSKTNGEIEVTRISKQHVDSFCEGMELKKTQNP